MIALPLNVQQMTIASQGSFGPTIQSENMKIQPIFITKVQFSDDCSAVQFQIHCTLLCHASVIFEC